MSEFEHIATNDVTYWPVLWIVLIGIGVALIGGVITALSDYGEGEGIGMTLVVLGILGGLFGAIIGAGAVESDGHTEAITAGLVEQDLQYLDREGDRWSAIAEDGSYVTGIWDSEGRRYTFIVVEGLRIDK